MNRLVGGTSLFGAGATLALVIGTSTVIASAATVSGPAVLNVGQIASQDVKTQSGCEADTLVEPDIAVSPFNSSIAVATAHDCRFSTGGAVDISYAWTHDGGVHWHHAAMPGLTRAVGGVWDRASDPVVDFGADGSVYVNALVFDATTCPTGLTMSRSTDGGATFGRPVVVQKSASCNYSDDKNWMVVDRQPRSPFYGRIYVFWTPFLADSSGRPTGNPQVVRWSDDKGRTWSNTAQVTGVHQSTQGSQPFIRPDGSITDVFMHSPTLTSAQNDLYARTSFDGGATWTPASVITTNIGGGAAGIRCCLPAASGDPVRGEMYAAWFANDASESVVISRSSDGLHWSAPIAVTHDTEKTIQHVNVAVAAYGGRVFVTYGRRDTSLSGGRYVQQQVSSSYNGGVSFGSPISLGPLSDLKYAAVAGGTFPGDYIGASATAGRVVLAWCISSAPPNPNAAYHQTLWEATLAP
jgi:hypothetical protein